MQIIVYCEPKYTAQGIINFSPANDLLEAGYKVISITPQHCSIATGSTFSSKLFGGYAVLLEKADTDIKL